MSGFAVHFTQIAQTSCTLSYLYYQIFISCNVNLNHSQYCTGAKDVRLTELRYRRASTVYTVCMAKPLIILLCLRLSSYRVFDLYIPGNLNKISSMVLQEQYLSLSGKINSCSGSFKWDRPCHKMKVKIKACLDCIDERHSGMFIAHKIGLVICPSTMHVV